MFRILCHKATIFNSCYCGTWLHIKNCTPTEALFLLDNLNGAEKYDRAYIASRKANCQNREVNMWFPPTEHNRAFLRI
jgi:hypothetical protein